MFPAPALLAAVVRAVPRFLLAAPPEPLTGGSLNHVWRLRARDGSTLILKHAPPHVATQPGVPLAPERLAFEARALGLFQAGGKFSALAGVSLRPPRLLAYDPAHHFLLLEDVGAAPDLAAAISTRADAPRIGRALGLFIGRLHGQSAGDPALARDFDNRAIQTARDRIQYRAIAGLAQASGFDAAAVARIDAHATALGRRLLAPGRCLVMGDLWPRSLLVAGSALRLIDWEFVHYGHPLQDLAHFGAHCWMQAHTGATPALAQGWSDLWHGFVGAYRETGAAALLGPADERLMDIHAGAEIFARCAGPFVRGYCYDRLDRDHPFLAAARTRAGQLCLAEEDRNKSGAHPSHLGMEFLRFSALCFTAATLLAPALRAFDHTHAALDGLLKRHVAAGAVDYAALKTAPAPLDAYLATLAAVTETDFAAWPEKERLAFLINLYNAATLKLIVVNYPLKSIRSIGWLPGAAWKQEGVSLFGRKVSLDHVEHGIIRREYRDARVHFALVCAAVGCPPLRSEAFVAARLDAQLDDQGRVFLAQPGKNRVDAATGTVWLSQIFKWFAGDFEAEAGTVLKFATPFFPPEAQRALAAGTFKVQFTHYDWSLNDRAAP